MKIVYDVSYIQRRMFGIGRSSRELLRALIEVRPLILHGWSWSIDRGAIEELGGKEACVSVLRIPGPVKRWYWSSLKTPRLESLVGDFDIFHSADPSLPPTNKKTVATLHDFAYRRLPGAFPFDTRLMHRRVLKALARADRILVPSQFTLEELQDVAPLEAEKAVVIPWPVGRQFSPDPHPELDRRVMMHHRLDRPYVLSVGTLEPRKNLVTLLDAMELVWREGKKDVQLAVAGGEGWMNADLMAQLRQRERMGRVRLLGELGEKDLSSVYRCAQLVVYPSLYEGFGLPVVEAMASGVPVITSNTSALKEVGGEAAMLVDPKEPETLAGAIQKVLTDRQLQMGMRQKGLERAALFSHANAAASVFRVYTSLKG